MIEITWTEQLPVDGGYYLFQYVHKPKDMVWKRVDQETGPRLIYVAGFEMGEMKAKDRNSGVWYPLPITKGDWKAEYSADALDLGKSFDYL